MVDIGTPVFMFQFPMGKVKSALGATVVLNGTVFQFPMGKVKLRRYGKYLWIITLFQFPMGKVKLILFMLLFKPRRVSIPYGKGKEQHFVLCFKYTP